MAETPHNVTETLAYCRGQVRDLNPPSKYGETWHNDCQAFVHVAWGLLTGGFSTAYLQWLGLSPHDRHATSDLSDAPVGALLFSKGTSSSGHVYIAARRMRDGRKGAFSSDANPHVFGGIGKVSRNFPATNWGHRILGWGTSVNGYQLDLRREGRGAGDEPAPPQLMPYERIQQALDNLRVARDEAKKDGNPDEADMIQREINRLKIALDVARN